jgi:hypothetical protein
MKKFFSTKGTPAPLATRTYSDLLGSVSELLESARRASARAVNTFMTATYWEIGRRLVEFEQSGEKRAGYGEELLTRLSQDLSARLGRGFSRQNLQNMRLLYLSAPPDRICQTLSGKLAQPGNRQTVSGKSSPAQRSPTSMRGQAILRTASARSSLSLPLADLAHAFPLPWSRWPAAATRALNACADFFRRRLDLPGQGGAITGQGVPTVLKRNPSSS